jgi:hypothetical protein
MRTYTFDEIRALNPCYSDEQLAGLVGGGITAAGIADTAIPNGDKVWVMTRLLALQDRAALAAVARNCANRAESYADYADYATWAARAANAAAHATTYANAAAEAAAHAYAAAEAADDANAAAYAHARDEERRLQIAELVTALGVG